MSNTLHVTTVATNEYTGLVPLWLHYLLEAYPHYHATVFTRDLPDNIADALKNHKHADKFQIVDDEFDGYPGGAAEGDQMASAALKYLIFTSARVEKYFEDTKYSYGSDIDMLILREEPGILEQHIEHCATLGLPYSNAIRPNDPPTVMGLNFVTAEYIDRIRKTSDIWDAKFKESGMSLIERPQRVPDERVLYELIRDSGIGLPPHPDGVEQGKCTPKTPLFRPWHGLNLGFARHPEFLGERVATNVARWAAFKAVMNYEYFELIPDWAKKAIIAMDRKWG